MKKVVSLLLALTLLLASGLSFASAEETYKGELKYLMGFQGTDPNEEPPAKMIEELTGYKVTYYMLPRMKSSTWN